MSDIQRFVGVSKGPYTSWDPVNRPMIRQWCEVMEDNNPVYADAEAARALGHEECIAPAAMLQVWGMAGYRGEHPPGSADDSHYTLMQDVRDQGYTGVVAVNCEQEYERYLVERDRLHYTTECETVQGPKQTALGEGYFVTELTRYFDQNDKLVGTMRFRLLFYKPKGSV
ncbi:MAG: MaoC family dehydratase N-terminal domain-containing protein [Pseudomonadota bacterium]